jgi:hypothetical protein
MTRRYFLRIALTLLMCSALLLLASCVEEDWECPALPQNSIQEEIDVPDWDDDIHQQV